MSISDYIRDALKNVGNLLIGHPYTGCSAYMILVCGLLITDYSLKVKEHSQTILFTALLPEILSIVTVIKPCYCAMLIRQCYLHTSANKWYINILKCQEGEQFLHCGLFCIFQVWLPVKEMVYIVRVPNCSMYVILFSFHYVYCLKPLMTIYIIQG